MIFRLVVGSLMARGVTVGMTVLSIGLSVALFLGVDKVKTGAKASFSDTISGTDLIVGARSGSVQLLLYSVFRIGNATNNVSWKSEFTTFSIIVFNMIMYILRSNRNLLYPNY